MQNDNSCWCMVDIQGNPVKARIVHTSRGRYRIEDDEGGEFRGLVIDASDVLSCNIDRISPPMDSENIISPNDSDTGLHN